jgi:hypothetical protein
MHALLIKYAVGSAGGGPTAQHGAQAHSRLLAALSGASSFSSRLARPAPPPVPRLRRLSGWNGLPGGGGRAGVRGSVRRCPGYVGRRATPVLLLQALQAAGAPIGGREEQSRGGGWPRPRGWRRVEGSKTLYGSDGAPRGPINSGLKEPLSLARAPGSQISAPPDLSWRWSCTHHPPRVPPVPRCTAAPAHTHIKVRSPALLPRDTTARPAARQARLVQPCRLSPCTAARRGPCARRGRVIAAAPAHPRLSEAAAYYCRTGKNGRGRGCQRPGVRQRFRYGEGGLTAAPRAEQRSLRGRC